MSIIITEYITAVNAIERAINKTSNPALSELITKFSRAIWFNYVQEKSTNTTYWYDQFKNPEIFNKILFHLCNSGWVISITEPSRNWAELSINQEKVLSLYSKDEIYKLRVDYKFKRYQLPDSNVVVKDTTITKTPVGLKSTGLTRPGATKQASNTFKYDIAMLSKYYDVIKLNLTKSMRLLPTESAKEVRYDDVSVEILNHLINYDETHRIGNAYIDSRGRLIKELLSKVFNPISNKDARALLVVEPKKLGMKGMCRVFLAISELLGYKPSTLKEKIELGKVAYENRQLLALDFVDHRAEIKALMLDAGCDTETINLALEKELIRVEHHRADACHNIWLERIYFNLDCYEPVMSNWNTPIELDQTASMLQIQGVLLNHRPFLEMTNVIGDTLKDAWSFNEAGITRKQFKTAMTPRLYGSSQSCSTLWTRGKIKWDMNQVKAFDKEISTGAMAVADKFKEFIIGNVKCEEVMTPKIWNEEFTIYPNRFKSIGDYTLKYDIYDSRMKSVRTLYHTHTKRVSDLDQFRTYFVTLLIHNLDSQLADFIESNTDWCLAIYDAFIVHPADAEQVEVAYCNFMKDMHHNREEILSDFFKSVGITTKSKQYTDLLAVIQPLEDEFIPQATALK